MKGYSFMTVNQRKRIDWICDILDIEYTGSPYAVDAYDFIEEHNAEAFRIYERIISIENFYSQF